MTDNQNPETQTTEEDDSSPNIRRMRERIKELEAENRTKEDALRMAAFHQAGVDPEAPGLGKAVFRTYEGPTDPAAIVEFAKQEYGWEPSAKPKATPSEAHQRLAEIDAAAVPEHPPVLDEQISEAEKNGAWMQSLALKTQALRQLT